MITNSSLGPHEACSYEKKPDPIFLFFFLFFFLKRISGLRETSMIPFESYSKVQKQSPGVFRKKGALRNLAKFTGKDLASDLQLY